MGERSTRTVPADTLRHLMERLLIAAGCAADAAAVAAEGFLEADLRGNAIQGLDHMFLVLDRLRAGLINGRARPRIIREGPAFALVDGDAGLGHAAGVMTADVAARIARASGCCAAALVNADDIFMLGHYADRLARSGLVGMVFTHSYPPRVRAWGGLDRVLGTNPFAIGIPGGGGHPVVLDCAASASASGHIRIAGYEGESIPVGLAVDADGRPTTDPETALSGALEPFGGHKGYGLALMVAILAGPLIGALLGKSMKAAYERPSATSGRRGHLFLAVDPAAFGNIVAFEEAVGAYVAAIKGSRVALDTDGPRVPGERADRLRRRALAHGVYVYDSVWRNTASLANDLGVPMPD